MLPGLLLNAMVALVIIILGLYAVTFSGTFAKWTADFDGKFSRAHFKEKVYQIGFRVIGVCFVVFGVLVILLLV